MDDLNLLKLHMPVFFFDQKEQLFPVNYTTYISSKIITNSNNVTCSVLRTSTKIILVYFLFFLYDAGIKVASKTFDSHQYDIEEIRVELDINTKYVSGVLYAPHSSLEHLWVRNDDDLKTILINNARPLAYISLNKHAIYAVPGTIFRFGGFANDKCNPNIPPPDNFTITIASQSILNSRVSPSITSLQKRLERITDKTKNVKLSSLKTRVLFGRW